jgi:predicted methyltransferase
MGFVSVLGFAQQLVRQRTNSGDIVVDATVGNGVDTLFLAQIVQTSGLVYGFDIQQSALDGASLRLVNKLGEEAMQAIRLIKQSHDTMADWVPAAAHGRVSAVMFNLGYLPGGDISLITTPQTTLPALHAALMLLKAGGVLTIILYPGHEGGQAEADAVDAWSAELPSASFQTLRYAFTNTHNQSPYLIAVEKRKGHSR